MNEWFKKIIQRIKELWGKWTLVQKLIGFTIIAVLIGSVILLSVISASPSSVPLITTPISDEQMRMKISARLDEEGVDHTISADGRILVKDLATAQRMRAILFRENLIPEGTSPWDVFQLDRWTVTDFERNVNLRQAITRDLEIHIEALEDVDNAEITLVMPEQQLFVEDQKPVTASVIITPVPGSDITTNRKKIEGIVRLVMFAVEGLSKDNIVITDHNGIV
jgi:flagellar M-ring protein FliF